jgi:hypothetical protein
MKKRAFLLLIVAFVMFQLDGHVELTYPEGGETFHPGDAVNVTWEEVVRHNFLGWTLLFSGDGGDTWDTIQANMSLETLEYRWIVPVTQTVEGRIKIIQDNEEEDYEWSSNNFTITSATGVDDPRYSMQLKIYPNPLVDYTTIEFDNSLHLDHTLNIFDTQGSIVRSIFNITSDRIQVDRKNLKSGLYFIQLRDEDEFRAVGKLAVE